jgi:hypothetical protein
VIHGPRGGDIGGDTVLVQMVWNLRFRGDFGQANSSDIDHVEMGETMSELREHVRVNLSVCMLARSTRTLDILQYVMFLLTSARAWHQHEN